MRNPIDGGNQPKKELSPVERRTIQSFENIPLATLAHKVNLILVWKKLHSATSLDFKPNMGKEELPKIKKIIEEAGLYSGIVEVSRKGVTEEKFFVVNDKNNLEIISKLLPGDHWHDREVYMGLGKLFGFPATAIEAFDQNNQALQQGRKADFLLTLDEQKEKVPKDLQAYVGFLLSRAHFQQEIQIVREWAEEIKLIDPDLYSTISKKE